MSDNKEEFECFYCYKKCTSEFLRREHISYGHKGLIEFQSSKLYHNLLKTIIRQQNKDQFGQLKLRS